MFCAAALIDVGRRTDLVELALSEVRGVRTANRLSITEPFLGDVGVGLLNARDVEHKNVLGLLSAVIKSFRCGAARSACSCVRAIGDSFQFNVVASVCLKRRTSSGCSLANAKYSIIFLRAAPSFHARSICTLSISV
jgi:hypothetical protein